MEMAALRIQAGDRVNWLDPNRAMEWGGKVRIVSRKSSWSHHHPAYCMAIIPQMCNLLEYFCDKATAPCGISGSLCRGAMWTSSRPSQRDRYAILMAFTP